MKVMTIIGTRPEIIKMSCVIKELDKYTQQILLYYPHIHNTYQQLINKLFTQTFYKTFYKNIRNT